MANFSLKNIPDERYESLRASAESNHRSINGELIHLLEKTLKPNRRSAEEMRESARKVQACFGGRTFDLDEIDQFKRTGRT